MKRKRYFFRYLRLFFSLTYVITWTILLTEVASQLGWVSIQLPSAVFILAGFGPALAAAVLMAIWAGKRGIVALLRRLLIVRVGLGWYVVAILLPPAIILSSLGTHRLMGGQVDLSLPPALNFFKGQGEFTWLFILPVFISQFFLLIGEELGWRGYALPILQTKYSALTSSLILGVLWGVWHLPMRWTPRTDAAVGKIPFGVFLLDIVLAAILYTWLFNNTRGSVFLSTLFHAANNTAALFLPFIPEGGQDLNPLLIAVAIKFVLIILVVPFAGKKHLTKFFTAEERITLGEPEVSGAPSSEFYSDQEGVS